MTLLHILVKISERDWYCLRMAFLQLPTNKALLQ